MEDNKNFVKEITNIDENFAQWYTDIVLKAELADYTDTKGCIAIRPYGYAIWENIQNYADRKFKETGVKNTYFPVLIPESLLQKESVGTVRIIVTEGLDSLHTDKTTPHAKPEYIRKVNIWQA